MNQKCTFIREKSKIWFKSCIYLFDRIVTFKVLKKEINKQWDSPPVDKTVVSPQTFGKNKNMH